MRSAIAVVSAVVFASVAATAAQTQQPGQTTSPGSVSQPQTQQPPVTPSTPDRGRQDQPSSPTARAQTAAAMSSFIGCVEKGGAANQFVLHVTELPAGSAQATSGAVGAQGQAQAGARTGQTPAGTGTTGTQTTAQSGIRAGTSGAAMIGQRVELVGGTNLSAHAGHKVEITGTMVPRGTPPGRDGQPAADLRVNVSNVRMIASTCAPASTGTSGAGAAGTTGGTTTTTPAKPSMPPTSDQPKPDQKY